MHLLLRCIAVVQISIFTAKFSNRKSHILMDVDTQCNADEEETTPTNQANSEHSPSSKKRIVGDSGFHFTESGDFRDENGFAFQFDVSKDHSENQSRYEKIGEAVTECIYTIMETEYGLSRIPIPIGVDKSECSSFIFVSDDFTQSDKRKLVLINGSGAVKAGQWARSIIINDNLYPGSMFPYIEWAQSNDFDILVMNTNESGSGMKKSENPFEHAETVWDEFLGALQSRNVHIVAHSFGGVIVQNLSKKKDNFKDIVHKIAFTDSVHMGRIATGSSINWVSSSKVANAYLGERLGCVIRSAGSTKHPWTSHYAMNHIFEWFMENENCAEFESNKTVQKSDKIFDESVSDSVSNDQ